MKISPVGLELFRTGGRTDMTKILVVFRCSANAPNNAPPQSEVILLLNMINTTSLCTGPYSSLCCPQNRPQLRVALDLKRRGLN